MATANSVQRAQTLTTPHTLNDPTEQSGKVKCLWATWESTAVAAGSVISWFTLPANARPIAAYVTADDEAASSTITLGDSDDADGYMVAKTIATGPTYYDCIAAGGAYWLGNVGINDADTVVTSTTAGATLTGSATITVTMFYVQG